MLDNVCLLITGGTGSFGNAVLKRFLSSNVREIRIFSRDEKKQDDMRKKYNNEKLTFIIGDVRNKDSVSDAMIGVDYVFHAAALKQVPSCEFFPMEAVKTNIVGTQNAIEAAHSANVRKFICLSTDKAVHPVNAMGMSKAMMEKVMAAKARTLGPDQMMLCATRYGNVMASRGSVIPLFIRQVMSGKPITITDPEMTRFMMTLEQAVDLVLFSFEHGRSGDIFVQKAPAATIHTLAVAICELFERPNHPIDVLGTRHGEKKHEMLLSREELFNTEDLGDYYRVAPDSRDLNYGKFVDSGDRRISHAEDYTSENTTRLEKEELKRVLAGLHLVKDAMAGKPINPEV